MPKLSCKSYSTPSDQSRTEEVAELCQTDDLQFLRLKFWWPFLVIFSWPFLLIILHPCAPLPSLAQLTSPYIGLHVPERPPPHKIILHTSKFLLHTLCSKTHYFRTALICRNEQVLVNEDLLRDIFKHITMQTGFSHGNHRAECSALHTERKIIPGAGAVWQ